MYYFIAWQKQLHIPRQKENMIDLKDVHVFLLANIGNYRNLSANIAF